METSKAHPTHSVSSVSKHKSLKRLLDKQPELFTIARDVNSSGTYSKVDMYLLPLFEAVVLVRGRTGFLFC